MEDCGLANALAFSLYVSFPSMWFSNISLHANLPPKKKKGKKERKSEVLVLHGLSCFPWKAIMLYETDEILKFMKTPKGINNLVDEKEE